MKRFTAGLATAVLAGAMAVVMTTASPAGAAVHTSTSSSGLVFTSAGAITVPGAGTGPAAANPYPSTINVTNAGGSISDVNVVLNGLDHTFMADVEIVLVGPGGQNVSLLADVGSGSDAVNATMRFDDEAAATYSTGNPNGTFLPTDPVGNEVFPAPAPAEPHGAALSVFDGTNPTGVWSLFVHDDAGADVGNIDSWSLELGSNIVIADAVEANPYPSAIVVSGEGTITDVNVTLNGFDHTCLGDLDVLLQAPSGATVSLLANQGGYATDAINDTMTFDDGAAGPYSGGDPGGTFQPSTAANVGNADPSPPAPAGPHNPFLGDLNGAEANGTWRLWVDDQVGGDSGNIDSWSLDITSGGGSSTVTVVASTPTAVEGGDDGIFTFSRFGGNLSQPLTIAISVAGTATSGDDYTALQTSVTIPAGEQSVTRAVAALADAAVDPDETVVVTVADGVGYTPGQPQSGTVTIEDGVAPEPPCDPSAPSGFPDVPADNNHASNIGCIAEFGIAEGLADGTYGPSVPTNRGQMATFVARTVTVAGVDLKPVPVDAFPGDDAGEPHELSINQLGDLGLFDGTTGEDGDEYQPTDPMRRDDMAQFLVNAFEIITGSPLPAGTDAFTDDEGTASDNEAAINALAAAGIVLGTGEPGIYDPDGTVSRGQMGSFLARFLDLLVENGVTLTPLA